MVDNSKHVWRWDKENDNRRRAYYGYKGFSSGGLCVVCGKTALYKFNNVLTCREHKQTAIDAAKKNIRVRLIRSAAVTEMFDRKDKRFKQHRAASTTSRFGHRH